MVINRTSPANVTAASAAPAAENPLGAYLKDRRAKLDPTAFGFPAARRRTPGLRREEVAQRAHVSATWYTWLEQGRGGAPSVDALDRIARALALTEVERDNLFLLALNHPPEIVKHRVAASVSPRLQRVLDSLEYSPTLVKNAEWDILAWNDAALSVLGDYTAMEPDRRNVLLMMFHHPRVRAAQVDWESVARFVVATFRADTTRAGVSRRAQFLVDD